MHKALGLVSSTTINNQSGIKIIVRLEITGAMLKRRLNSYRGAGLSFKHPQNSTQESVTLVLGNLTSSSDPHRHQACVWYTCKHTDNIFIHIKWKHILKTNKRNNWREENIFSLKDFTFNCVYMHACMWVCAWECRWLWRPKGGAVCPEVEGTGTC